MPRATRRRPRLEAVSPFPKLEATPPVTKICLVTCPWRSSFWLMEVEPIIEKATVLAWRGVRLRVLAH